MLEQLIKWKKPTFKPNFLHWAVLFGAALSLGLSMGSIAAASAAEPSALQRFVQNSVISQPSDRSASQKSSEALQQQLLQDLQRSQVIYLGETHDSKADHQLQLQIIDHLYQQNPNLILGMEMFQVPYQSILDRYGTGQVTEAELLDRTEYNTRWGFPWALYAPIVQFAKSRAMPIVALNTPAEVTRKVSRKGLSSLEAAERRFIPPLSEIELGPPAYRDRIVQIFTAMHQGLGNSKGVDAFFQAQVLWDETMADRISQTLLSRIPKRSPLPQSDLSIAQSPRPQIVVLVGQGHLLYGDGIPRRVKRRLQSQHAGFSQTTILLNPDPNFTPSEPTTQAPIGDWIWRSPIAPSDQLNPGEPKADRP